MGLATIYDEFTYTIASANARWKLRHPERYNKSERERNARYKERHPLRALLKRIKSRAKSSGLEFNITEEDLGEIPEICPVLGIKLERNNKNGAHANSPSIDRIDNTKGYIKGNVKIISWRANSLKRDATIEELEAILNYMKEYVSRAA